MTISTTASRTVQQGNAVTTVWNYAFLIPDSNSILVTRTDSAGVSTVLTSNLYSVSGLGVPAGGSVTYPLSGTPIPADGSTITIERTVPYTQPSQISGQGAFYPAVVETALDRIVMEVQQLNDKLLRTLTVPSTDLTNPAALPSAVTRANKSMIFDANGNPIAGSTTATAISAAMIAVVQAATIALARAALGLDTGNSPTFTNETLTGTLSVAGLATLTQGLTGGMLNDTGAGFHKSLVGTLGLGVMKTATIALQNTGGHGFLIIAGLRIAGSLGHSRACWLIGGDGPGNSYGATEIARVNSGGSATISAITVNANGTLTFTLANASGAQTGDFGITIVGAQPGTAGNIPTIAAV